MQCKFFITFSEFTHSGKRATLLTLLASLCLHISHLAHVKTQSDLAIICSNTKMWFSIIPECKKDINNNIQLLLSSTMYFPEFGLIIIGN